ncbi:hypothetical protein [Aeromonas hydrophila]|uniref:hypothetical protein n=1 Tax=Aeromonas hydrophila TaxID=644 RepID=UPI002442A37F|nr:hypothetical protein [Aeromonas hydrophila]
MKFKKWLEEWDMTSLKIKTPFLEMDWSPKDEDKEAAWEMYIELLTRVTTQSLSSDTGNEDAALKSVHSLFAITRDIIKKKWAPLYNIYKNCCCSVKPSYKAIYIEMA